MNNILLTSAGRRVSLLRCFQRDLRERELSGAVFATDLAPERSAACQVADKAFAVPRVTDPSYADTLLELCLRENVRMVVPTIDTELLVLAQNRKQFREQGVEVIISDLPLIQQCRDKRKTHDLFASHGLACPEVFSEDTLQYPCFAKPIDGSCSVGLHLVSSADHWPSNVRHNPNYLICAYIDPQSHDEYTVDMFYSAAGDLLCVVPRQRLQVRGGEVSKGKTVRHALIGEVERSLGQLPGARGCLTLQVFVHKEEGTVLGIEINPRFGGGYPLTSQAGARYTDWLVGEVFAGETIAPCNAWQHDLVMLRYDEGIFRHEDSAAS